MLRLLKYTDKLEIEPEILTLVPFKKIYDSHPNKEEVINIFAFIYFYSDPRSDYQYLVNNESREKAIKEGLGLPDDWTITPDIQEAITYYESFKPMASLLLEDTRFAVDKLRIALREIDFTQVDDKGKPIYPLNTLTSTIKLIPSLVRDLNDAEKAVNSEIRADIKARGSQEKSLFDDGIKL